MMWLRRGNTVYTSKSESTLELQSRVAPSVEYVATNMVPTQEKIPGEGRWEKKQVCEQFFQVRSYKYNVTKRFYLYDSMVCGVHVTVQREGAFAVAIVSFVAIGCNNPILRKTKKNIKCKNLHIKIKYLKKFILI